jgi:hypothetical protein
VDNGEAESTPVSGETMVVVFSSDRGRQADHVMSLLESEGIPAFVHSATGEDSLDDDDSEFDLIIKVEEEDADRAREVIESAEHELEVDED